jgi:DNA polymerase-3 subunit epsilon
MQLKAEIHDVSWELTGSEFLAYLLETLEIKRLWPKYNRAQKYKSRQWALFQYEDNQGYIRFQVSKNNQKIPHLLTFDSHSEAWNFMIGQTEKFDLCPKLTGIQKTTKHCYDYQVGKCQGACITQENPENYNKKANDFVSSIRSERGNILIKEKGKTPEESCAMLFENGVFTGYAFISQEEFLHQNEEILSRLNRVKPIPETKYILRSFIPKVHLRNIIPIN